MTVHASRLARAYHQRRGTFAGERRLGDWRLKLYGLAAPDKGVRPALLDRTHALAAATLPPVDDAHHGVAFAIAHDARFPIALIYWWQDENELHSAIFAGAEVDGLEPAGPTAMGCVWELGIVEFERRAWIEDVIGNPDGPDLDGYLARRFGGLV
jgi:hypothetical protein